MKFIISKRAKRILGTLVSVLLLVIVLLNIGGYFLDIKYISVFTIIAQVDKYEVRSHLMMEAMKQVGVCEPKDAAKVWANGLIHRNGAMQFSVMSEQLRNKYLQQLEQTSPNWVTGMSSPWVDGYRTIKVKKQNEVAYTFELCISTASSTGHNEDYAAILTVAKEGGFWYILNISMDDGLFPYTRFKPSS